MDYNIKAQLTRLPIPLMNTNYKNHTQKRNTKEIIS